MANYGDLIHAVLAGTVASFDFPKVAFANRAGTVGYVRTTSGATAKACSITVDESSSGFVVSANNRRAFGTGTPLERVDWTWILDIRFKGPVSTEEFEKELATNPPRVLRDPGSGLDQQVTLVLQESEHLQIPTRQQPTTGTQVRYRLTASLTPL